MQSTTRLLHSGVFRFLQKARNSLINMVRLTGFEPVAYGLEDPCLNVPHLTYQQLTNKIFFLAAVKWHIKQLIFTRHYTFTTRSNYVLMANETPHPTLVGRGGGVHKCSACDEQLMYQQAQKVLLSVSRGAGNLDPVLVLGCGVETCLTRFFNALFAGHVVWVGGLVSVKCGFMGRSRHMLDAGVIGVCDV